MPFDTPGDSTLVPSIQPLCLSLSFPQCSGLQGKMNGGVTVVAVETMTLSFTFACNPPGLCSLPSLSYSSLNTLNPLPKRPRPVRVPTVLPRVAQGLRRLPSLLHFSGTSFSPSSSKFLASGPLVQH